MHCADISLWSAVIAHSAGQLSQIRLLLYTFEMYYIYLQNDF